MPSVSIIVPIYNAEKYLLRCVDSVMTQTCTDFELILVDDGSTDNCGAICDEYAKKDCRVKVIHQNNSGVSTARNAGLDAAVGKYILFVDSDDFINSDFAAQLCVQDSDLAVCGITIQDEWGNQLYTVKHQGVIYGQRDEIDYAKLYKENVLYSPYCKLFLNSIIQEHCLRFPQGVSWGEDGMFVADYLEYVDSIAVLEYVGYHYVKYEAETSLSTKVRADVVDMIDLSRTYCIERMLKTSPNQFAAVKEVCTEDAKWNIVYFIRKLFENEVQSKKEKIAILKKYLKNRYVEDILSDVNFYFAGHAEYHVVLTKSNASKMINYYYWGKRKHEICNFLYRAYDSVPEFVKNIYRHMKNKVKK